jgi:Domain of unknown function (DUF4352)
VRTAILTGGALVVGLLLGLLTGIVAGTLLAGPDQAQSPKTVTVKETEYVTVTASPTPSPTSTATATATATADPEQATKTCKIGQKCDLGSGTVLIRNAKKVGVLTAEYTPPKQGSYVVVEFDYTYNGDSPVSLGEIPWVLTDGEGRSYNYDSDATIDYSNVDESILYEEVNPGVTRPGKAIFAVAPDAKDFTLTITDLATPQAGEAANVEF